MSVGLLIFLLSVKEFNYVIPTAGGAMSMLLSGLLTTAANRGRVHRFLAGAGRKNTHGGRFACAARKLHRSCSLAQKGRTEDLEAKRVHRAFKPRTAGRGIFYAQTTWASMIEG